MSVGSTELSGAQPDQMNDLGLREEIEEQVEKESLNDDDVFMAMSENGHGSSHCSECVTDG